MVVLMVKEQSQLTIRKKVEIPLDGRITIPKRLANLVGFTGEQKIACLLIIIQEGRAIVQEMEIALKDLRIQRLWNIVNQQNASSNDLMSPISPEQASLPFRIYKCSVSPPPPAYRLDFPTELNHFFEITKEKRLLYLVGHPGFIEILSAKFILNGLAADIPSILGE